MSLPIIDLADSAASPERHAATVDLIARNARDLGFFYVVGHGIPAALVDGQLAWAERFFALPDAAKQAIDFRNLPVPRGFEPMALQTLQAGMQPDQKEAFAYGRDPTAKPGAAFEGPNQWPAPAAAFDAAAFRTQMEAYRDAVHGLGLRLTSLLGKAMGLAPDHFGDAMADPSIMVRLLHYPPQPAGTPADRLGCGAHTDWGLITILLQDDCGGLEIETPGGWISATPVPGAMIVNLGDIVERMTGGGLASNVHRVLNRTPERHRYSVATFFNPPGYYEVAAIPAFFADGTMPPSIRFSDHIQAKIAATYASA